MPRTISLFTTQWRDLPLPDLCAKARALGFEGLDIACAAHLDVHAALTDPAAALAPLRQHSLALTALCAHGAGQVIGDLPSPRHKRIIPAHVWGDGDPEGVCARAERELRATLALAVKLGVPTVHGFVGSTIFHLALAYPGVTPDETRAGYDDFARRWGPILDYAKSIGARFALEVHPGQIAYDYHTTEIALEAVGNHPALGFLVDPSHLLWQGVAPNKFIERFPDRIWAVHLKDVAIHYGAGGHRGGDGMSSVLGSHLPYGDVRRGWDYRAVGRGHTTWEGLIRALNRIGYSGALSIEISDPGMDRDHAARESIAAARRMDFPPSATAAEERFRR